MPFVGESNKCRVGLVFLLDIWFVHAISMVGYVAFYFFLLKDEYFNSLVELDWVGIPYCDLKML